MDIANAASSGGIGILLGLWRKTTTNREVWVCRTMKRLLPPAVSPYLDAYGGKSA